MSKLEKIILLGIGIVIIVSILVGTTYSFWNFSKIQTNANQIVSKCFDLSFEENNQKLSLKNSYPMTLEESKTLTPYTFTLKNHCNNEVNYQINMEVLKESTLNENYVRTSINNQESKLLESTLNTDRVIEGSKSSYKIEEGVINANETKTFEVRMWLDGSVSGENEETMHKSFTSQISVEGSYKGYKGIYTEDILNGADPILKGELVPVTIANDGKVYKADETKEWYSYEKKIWANAVILEDETIQYNNGETIPESNIESYFVWIPRYRYQIFNDGLYYGLSDTVSNQAQEIKVVFESKERQISDGVRKGSWLTHPAFTSFDVNGIWVGKYETGYKEATTKVEGEQNIVDSNKIQIKPNVYSWRGIQVANAHLNSKNYKSNLDSHMMKNTEWGAVAYLSHSKYGSMQSVRINNYEEYKTGYSSVSEPTCGYTGNNESCNKYGTTEDITQPYNTDIGVLASTTANISGIYDMSGGSIEYMMGVMANKSGNILVGNENVSGFNGYDKNNSPIINGVNFPESKYYDLYASYDLGMNGYHRRILGDATGEIGPFALKTYGVNSRQISSWYMNEAWTTDMEHSWIVRGAVDNGVNNGSGAGVFAFASGLGRAYHSASYRLVLAF